VRERRAGTRERRVKERRGDLPSRRLRHHGGLILSDHPRCKSAPDRRGEERRGRAREQRAGGRRELEDRAAER
jgi:hypothetical protein